MGLGRLGQQVASLLLEHGVDVHAADLEHPGRRPVLPGLGPPGPAPPGRGRLSVVNHWSKPDRDDLDLTVVATEAAEVDRVVTDHLLRRDEPHLLLRSGGSTVTVGPLVVPGRTACVRCTDLARRDADRSWPQLLPQLVRLRQPTTAVLTAWAASVGAAQVAAFVDGTWPESAGATLELSGRDHLMRWRAWPVHPACGCAWSGTTEWGP